MTINTWQRAVHALAREKGWHTTKDPIENVWKYLGNIHAEVSEAWEEARLPEFDPRVIHENPDGKPLGFGPELADIVIRVMDTCEVLGINLEEMIRIKHEYNRGREQRHGNKRA